MTEDRYDLIHLKLCDNTRRHRSHDWFIDDQWYKCIGFGFIGNWGEQVPPGIIRKACDLKIAHSLHIWKVPFLDGYVRYYCQGIS